MKTQLRRCLLAALILSVGPSLLSAGAIDPGLDATIGSLSPGEMTTVLVLLRDQAPIASLDRMLSDAEASRLVRHETIVRALQGAASGQESLVADLDLRMRSGEVDGYRTYWIVNAVVVRGDASAIRAIADREDVSRVMANPKPALIDPVGVRDAAERLRGIGVTPGVRAVQADRVWEELGLTGRGRLVANIDTGVDGNHPALRDRWRGNNGHPWQECWLDVLSGTTQYPVDGGQHGTHVMGTLTGLGADTGDTVGVAWGAQWIACNAINQGAGGEFANDILNAFQWLADPDGDPATIDDVPDVVQNSWGVHEGMGYADCYDGWWQVIDNCEAAGCVVIFSAGNEGPDPMTLRVPADRTTTPINIVAVGAVDATNYGWPYPIAGFSSRGPSGCPGNDIKPEVSAPGVDVYSSVPGGGYAQGGWSGTSMAGPHVSGIVALMREANPDLEVNTIKQVLLDTAIDEGTPGEDNDYGFGLVDAFAAATIALEGTGVLQGSVVNLTDGGVPLPGAVVGLTGSAAHFPTDAAGLYRGHAIAGEYTAVARHPSFAPESAVVTLTLGGIAVQDFGLWDIAGPGITGVSDPRTIPNPAGPFEIRATVRDMSTIASVALVYRVNSSSWLETAMSPAGSLYTGLIPGQIAGSRVDFYVRARDVGGNETLFPADAPATFRTFYVTIPALVDDAELNQGWSLGYLGDTATNGIWVREDPNGTFVGNRPMQPEDDHTPDPGHICFVTGNADPGQPATTRDVDGGCTSLVSPTLNLAGTETVFVYYWRWFGQYGIAGDTFTVQVTTNNGLSWTDLEHLTAVDNRWNEVLLDLTDFISPNATTRLRFKVCDNGMDSTVEGAVDDVSIEILPPLPAAAEELDADLALALDPARPNPSAGASRISFRLATPGRATVELFDAAGRRVRTLIDASLDAGVHQVEWDGADDSGNRAGAGVYFYRLTSGGSVQSRRLVLAP